MGGELLFFADSGSSSPTLFYLPVDSLDRQEPDPTRKFSQANEVPKYPLPLTEDADAMIEQQDKDDETHSWKLPGPVLCS